MAAKGESWLQVPSRASPLPQGVLFRQSALHLFGVFHVVIPILRTLFQQFFFVFVHLVIPPFPCCRGEVT